MKCSRCNKNEATVLVREIVNGKETQYALCSYCDAETEAAAATSFLGKYAKSAGDIFSGFFATADTALKKEEKRCSLCTSTINDISKSGRVGCPVCYSVFETELEPTLSRLHGNAVHRGKVPYEAKREMTNEEKILQLQAKLSEAVREENYEEAAKLRDEIRGLKDAKEG